jgi:hypothetical protein
MDAKTHPLLARLGKIVLEAYGEQKCTDWYGGAEPAFVGWQALNFHDIEHDGTLT